MKRSFGFGLALTLTVLASSSQAWAFRLPNSSSCELAAQTYCLGLLAQGHKVLNDCLHEHYDQVDLRCKAQLDDERANRAKKSAKQ